MALPGILDVAPWRDFAGAARDVLHYLHDTIGWDVWAVTRVVGDRQVVLVAHPVSVLRPGAFIPWAESFCRPMVLGEAPRAATVTAAEPAYAHRTLGMVSGIAAYIGVPLVTAEGELFGSLCGVGFRARPRSASRDLPHVEMAARLLSTLMAAGLRPDDPPAVEEDRGSS